MTSPRRAASLPSAMKEIDATRARQLAWIALAVYLVGLGISATFRAQGDFNVYYRAGHRVLHGADRSFARSVSEILCYSCFVLRVRHVCVRLCAYILR